jgi:hypothetical protein
MTSTDTLRVDALCQEIAHLKEEIQQKDKLIDMLAKQVDLSTENHQLKNLLISKLQDEIANYTREEKARTELSEKVFCHLFPPLTTPIVQ